MRAKKRLTALQVEKLKVKGRYVDGDGVYLVVDEALNKRWEFLFAFGGKTRHMGLGPPGLGVAGRRPQRRGRSPPSGAAKHRPHR
jgi:hypothetical protein